MNYVLSVDTASSCLGICLKKDNSWFEYSASEGLKHSESLMKAILYILDQGKIRKEELELLVCSLGPGSFTGLRIGMATVKAMAFGLGIPYTGVPSTEYMAAGYEDFPGGVIPVLDARKKRFYCNIYHKGVAQGLPMDLGEEEILHKSKNYDSLFFTGPDCHLIKAEGRPHCYWDKNGQGSKSRQLLELGIQKYNQEGGMTDSAGPLYIRKSEAEILKDKGTVNV